MTVNAEGGGRKFLGHFKHHFEVTNDIINITETGSYLANGAKMCES